MPSVALPRVEARRVDEDEPLGVVLRQQRPLRRKLRSEDCTLFSKHTFENILKFPKPNESFNTQFIIPFIHDFNSLVFLNPLILLIWLIWHLRDVDTGHAVKALRREGLVYHEVHVAGRRVRLEADGDLRRGRAVRALAAGAHLSFSFLASFRSCLLCF